MLLAQAVPAETTSAQPAATVAGWLASMRQRIAAYVGACADYWAAASIYEELRGLSDTELRRRGMSRATLARDICDRIG